LVITDALREEIVATADPSRITSVMRNMLRLHGRSLSQAAEEAYESGIIPESELRKYRRR